MPTHERESDSSEASAPGGAERAVPATVALANPFASDLGSLVVTAAGLFPILGGICISLQALAMSLDPALPLQQLGASGLAMEGVRRGWWVLPALALVWIVSPAIARAPRRYARLLIISGVSSFAYFAALLVALVLVSIAAALGYGSLVAVSLIVLLTTVVANGLPEMVKPGGRQVAVVRKALCGFGLRLRDRRQTLVPS